MKVMLLFDLGEYNIESNAVMEVLLKQMH